MIVSHSSRLGRGLSSSLPLVQSESCDGDDDDDDGGGGGGGGDYAYDADPVVFRSREGGREESNWMSAHIFHSSNCVCLTIFW